MSLAEVALYASGRILTYNYDYSESHVYLNIAVDNKDLCMKYRLNQVEYIFGRSIYIYRIRKNGCVRISNIDSCSDTSVIKNMFEQLTKAIKN